MLFWAICRPCGTSLDALGTHFVDCFTHLLHHIRKVEDHPSPRSRCEPRCARPEDALALSHANPYPNLTNRETMILHSCDYSLAAFIWTWTTKNREEPIFLMLCIRNMAGWEELTAYIFMFSKFVCIISVEAVYVGVDKVVDPGATIGFDFEQLNREVN